MKHFELHLGDCLETLRGMADNSVDSIVTDPPYGLSDHKPADVVACLSAWLAGEPYLTNKRGFMGKTWDSWVPGPEVWRECLRVLKPGGYVLAFAGSRTHDLMSMAMRLAGFECRDTIMYLYGSGFPKSMDVSKQLDKMAGAVREVVGYDHSRARPNRIGKVMGEVEYDRSDNGATITAPATEAARQWQGWGTALKPAFEPVLMFRKPLIGTVAANVLEHGTGALNIDGCRVPTNGEQPKGSGTRDSWRELEGRDDRQTWNGGNVTPEAGCWPANICHDGSDEVLSAFPQASGAVAPVKGTEASAKTANAFGEFAGRAPSDRRDGGGSAARFFYTAKVSKRERNEGLPDGMTNIHPTLKPVSLMAYLCRLVTPPGGVVLDPFMGSGSTGKAAIREGFRFIGCELSEEYLAIASARIEHELSTRQQPATVPSPQPDLFTT